ncbi:MAG: bifunctional proline dehydrogenase/L-glutamate gamma-semialdehyde dehydrogenase PutA, partial [Pseudomonadota bacterium]
QDEAAALSHLARSCPIPAPLHAQASARAKALVTHIRSRKTPGLMEVFLAEYGLSTEEGVALMCLAEALLRVPDTDTIDALIEDKIAASEWSAHLGQSSSPLVNASTWALMLTGKVLAGSESPSNLLRGAIKRLGEPVIRLAVTRAMQELGGQFVLGETIEAAIARGHSARDKGYTFSYDMLGEAARTHADAKAYFDAYASAISSIAEGATGNSVRTRPGISVKLSALHPRYETSQHAQVMDALVPRVLTLAKAARAADLGFNIDAEEAARLDISLDVIEAVLRCPDLAGWDGFGVVVQAYGKRALPVIDWLYALAQAQDRTLMVRLVKGAYWDTEVKHAQVEGVAGFPVFTRKAATDVSYLHCAQRLLSRVDRLYPQFATHNAHSVAMVQCLAHALDVDPGAFEFQRLHGMGEALHDQLLAQGEARSRIYAPVGAHRDLLAYLVRRLLENGANSSFVNQIVDKEVPVADVVADPFGQLARTRPVVTQPPDLFAPERNNAAGWDLQDPVDIARFDAARAPFAQTHWHARPIVAGPINGGAREVIGNPADPQDRVGEVVLASAQDVASALDAARPWDAPAPERAEVLRAAADLYEANAGELFALMIREAGKTPLDAVAELREAVDFLRYYAARGAEGPARARGLFACISPWNFPLAIFTGQIAAALAAGNGVLAKPAEPTPLVAHRAVQLLHQAGVRVEALQVLPGHGADVGAALTRDPRIKGVCFTGSTATAQRIHRAMAAHLDPTAPLIAETGGLNAMIVDSTALPEQAVRDVLASAFQSAGQRCSALRVLYVQEDIADGFQEMLFGAMDALVVGNPWDRATDIGPIITPQARAGLLAHIAHARSEGRVLKDRTASPSQGHFVAPTVLGVSGLGDLSQEVFGPILHIARFKASELDRVVAEINASGYGLTFGLHTRIDDRVEEIAGAVRAGNNYINRNQIGAVVGVQPFGGEGMSGTGPKAGGPRYVQRFRAAPRITAPGVDGQALARAAVQRALDQVVPVDPQVRRQVLPGPTGEMNSLTERGRGLVLCLGPGAEAARTQSEAAQAAGCSALAVTPGAGDLGGLDGVLDPVDLEHLAGFEAVISYAPEAELRAQRAALAARDGAILPLLAEADFATWCRLERHVCVDTMAAGGNATLLAQAS